MNAFVESTHNARTDLARTALGGRRLKIFPITNTDFRSLREAGSHVVPACVTSRGCGKLESFLRFVMGYESNLINLLAPGFFLSEREHRLAQESRCRACGWPWQRQVLVESDVAWVSCLREKQPAAQVDGVLDCK
jgi:hypothetical protein